MTPNAIWDQMTISGVPEHQLDVEDVRDMISEVRRQPSLYVGTVRMPVFLGYQLHDLMNAWRSQPERDMSLSAFKDLDFGVLWVSAQRLKGEAREFALQVLADTVPVPTKRLVEAQAQIAMDNQLKALQYLYEDMNNGS